MTGALNGSLTLRDGLVLVAPGGLYVPDENTLVVADLHVGYTPTLRAKGYAVPVAPDDELITRLCEMLALTSASQLVVAGDLVHGPAATKPLCNGVSPLEMFVSAVAPTRVTVVLGNHDRRAKDTLVGMGLAATTTLSLGPHIIDHGDDPAQVHNARREARVRGGRAVIGHLHPALALDDSAGARATVPAFVTAPGLVCLPALAPFARGGDVRSSALRTQLGALVGADEMGAAVVIAGKVISVGNVFGENRRLPASPPAFTAISACPSPVRRGATRVRGLRRG